MDLGSILAAGGYGFKGYQEAQQRDADVARTRGLTESDKMRNQMIMQEIEDAKMARSAKGRAGDVMGSIFGGRPQGAPPTVQPGQASVPMAAPMPGASPMPDPGGAPDRVQLGGPPQMPPQAPQAPPAPPAPAGGGDDSRRLSASQQVTLPQLVTEIKRMAPNISGAELAMTIEQFKPILDSQSKAEIAELRAQLQSRGQDLRHESAMDKLGVALTALALRKEQGDRRLDQGDDRLDVSRDAEARRQQQGDRRLDQGDRRGDQGDRAQTERELARNARDARGDRSLDLREKSISRQELMDAWRRDHGDATFNETQATNEYRRKSSDRRLDQGDRRLDQADARGSGQKLTPAQEAMDQQISDARDEMAKVKRERGLTDADIQRKVVNGDPYWTRVTQRAGRKMYKDIYAGRTPPTAAAPKPDVAPSAAAPTVGGGGASSAAPLPTVGTVVDGYRFKGGDPAKPDSWDRVQ